MILGYLNMQTEHEFDDLDKEDIPTFLFSKCSGLGLNLPLSVQAVRIRQGYCLSHCYFRASSVNTQQVLPRLLRDLTIVGTWSAEKHVNTPCSPSAFPHFHCHLLSNSPCFSCMCPPFITPILLLSMGPGGSVDMQHRHFYDAKEQT